MPEADLDHCGALDTALRDADQVVLAASPSPLLAERESNVVAVTLTDGGCPESLALPAGPTTFAVSNDSARSVSEIEILKLD